MSIRLDHAKVKNLKLKFKKEKVLDRCPVNPAQVEVGVWGGGAVDIITHSVVSNCCSLS